MTMVYKNEIGDHLGDMLVYVSAGLIMSERLKAPVTLSTKYNRNAAITKTMVEELAALIDSDGTVISTTEEGTESLGNLWKGGIVGEGIQLLPFKPEYRWRGLPGKYVGYQFDGRSSPGKNPPEREIADIIAAAPRGLTPVKLGWPMTIQQSAEALRECGLFVGCDSGLAMMAIAAGVPTYILQYGMAIDHWKIGLEYTKCMRLHGWKAAMDLWPEIPQHDKQDHYFHRPIADVFERMKLMQYHAAGANENCIYFCVYGEEYRKMVCLAVESLRTTGKYTGRIIIVTPSMCPVLQSLEKDVSFIVANLPCHQRMALCYALELINPIRYNKIMYLDADIIATRDINPVLRELDVLTYYEEPWQHMRDQITDPIYVGYLTDDERRRMGGLRPINDGQWGCSGIRASDVHHVWKRLYESKSTTERDFYGANQAAFNAMIRRVQVRGRAFSKFSVCNAGHTPEAEWCQYGLTHFAGYKGRLEKMETTVAATRKVLATA
jgi:hypothetical protein